MPQQRTVQILGIGVSMRQLALLALIAVLGLHPFVFATMSPDPFFLALPWWYWADVGVLAVIYLLIQLYVRETVKLEGEATEADGSTGGDAGVEPEGGA